MSSPIAVALSKDVPAGTSIGVQVNDQNYVVWRDHSGKAHIWEDRCPHRGMKLSLGFVRGDHIACLYHGWEFDTGGQCQKIPAHPELTPPKTITVERFAVAERSGLIWLGLGETTDWPTNKDHYPVRSIMINAATGHVDPPEGVHVSIQPAGADRTMLHICADAETNVQSAFQWSLKMRADLEGVDQ